MCSHIPVVNEDTLSLFVSYCATALNLSYASCKQYLSGIRHYCITLANLNPLVTDNGSPLHRLFLVMRGIRRTEVKRNPLARLPITGRILARVCTLLTEGVFGQYMDLLLQAACNLAFFAFLRCGEFTSPSSKFHHTKGLSFSDVTITYEGQIATKLILNLKSSKTDPSERAAQSSFFLLVLSSALYATCLIS